MAASDFVPQPGRPDLTICQLCIIDGRGTSGRARFAGRKGRAASAGSWSQDAKEGLPGVTRALRAIMGQRAQAKATFGHFERMKPSSADNRANKSPGNKGCSVSRYSASPLKKCPKVETKPPGGLLAPHAPPVRPYSEQVWRHPRGGQQRSRQRPAPRRGKSLALHEEAPTEKRPELGPGLSFACTVASCYSSTSSN